MSNIEKVVKFLDALKLSRGAPAKTEQAAYHGVTSVAPDVSSSVSSVRSSISSATGQIFEQTAAVASSITQQGQTLLSKKDVGLSKKEKQLQCQFVTDIVLLYSGHNVGTDSNKVLAANSALSVGIETLLLLADDSAPDVRITADEALNKLVRGVTPLNLARVLVEQMRNNISGPVRVIKASLSRFAVIAKHIRVLKGRAYMQALVPLLCNLANRTEENLHESLSTALSLICPALGHFMSDNEVKLLLSSYHSNLSHNSAMIRRAAASALISICKNCKKPNIFLGCLISLVLKSVLPLSSSCDKSKVLGALSCLRLTAPFLSKLCHPESSAYNSEGMTSSTISTASPHSVSHTYSISFHQLAQIYQLSLHYCNDPDHNVVTASLELLKNLLDYAPDPLVTALISPGGIPRNYTQPGEMGSRKGPLGSRASSMGSISAGNFDDLAIDTDASSNDILMNLKEDEEAIAIKTPSENIEIEVGQEAAETLDTESKPTGETLPNRMVRELSATDDLYSSIEIGKLSEENENEVYFSGGLKDLDDEVNTQTKDPSIDETMTDDNISTDQLINADPIDSVNVKGDIGEPYGENTPATYLIRFLCSKFLLAGHIGSIVSDRQVRISAKVLALNCLGKALVWMPEIMEQTLFVMTDIKEGELELVQRIWDVSRFAGHGDPSVCSAAASMLGNYIRSAALNNLIDTDTGLGGNSAPEGLKKQDSTSSQVGEFSSPVSTEAILNTLKEMINRSSAVTARGAITGISACLPALITMQHTVSPQALLDVMPALLSATKHKYWLVRVEVCSLLSELPLSFIDFIENQLITSSINGSGKGTEKNLTNGGTNSSHWGVQCIDGNFSHRIFTQGLLCLLSDSDTRVRNAATQAIVKLVPELMLEKEFYNGTVPSFSHSGNVLSHNLSFYNNNDARTYSSDPKIQRKKLRTIDGSPFNTVQPYFDLIDKYEKICLSEVKLKSNETVSDGPYNKLPGDSNRFDPSKCDLGKVRERRVNSNLSRVIQTISETLLTTCDKNMKAGCIFTLSELSQKYHPVMYGVGWGCKKHSDYSVTALGLIHQMLLFTKDMSLVSDISTQAAIISVCCNILSGIGVCTLESEAPKKTKKSSKHSTAFTSEDTKSACSKVLQHILRVLSVYWHLVEDVPLKIVSQGPVDNTSPLKKKDKSGDRSKGDSSDSSSDSEKERQRLLHMKGRQNCVQFAHLPNYVKLYEVLRSTHSNFKISVCVLSEQKLCSILNASLQGLACLLEMLHADDIMAPLEQLIQFCTSALKLNPLDALCTAQQLIKCLFGSNLASIWHCHTFFTQDKSSNSHQQLPSSPDMALCNLQQELAQLQEGLHVFVCRCRGRQGSQSASAGRYIMTGSNSYSLDQTSRASLVSYIRLFEPLVIKGLNSYTSSNNVPLQKSVLELVLCLISIKVNYGLLDSNHVFLRYVMKQFEFIEEGQLKNAEQLIPSVFEFLVAISYERQQTRNIISIPKLIQICDGLLASGQPPLKSCVLALGPLVEEVFGTHALSSPAGTEQLECSLRTSIPVDDNSELATKREVLSCTLLRLAHYHEVVSLIGVMVCGARHQGPQKWKNVSEQVAGVLFPLLTAQHIDIHSQGAMSSVLEVLSCLCPSVYSPPDNLLKALLTSPISLDSTATVEVWVTNVVILLRLMVSRCSPQIILKRLTELGLSLHILPSMPSSPTPQAPPTGLQDPPTATQAPPTSMTVSTFSAFSSPIRRKVSRDTRIDSMMSSSQCSSLRQAFNDPLNVSQGDTSPESAIASYLLEVLRICAYEVRSVWCIRMQSGVTSKTNTSHSNSKQNISSTSGDFSNSVEDPDEHFLVFLTHQLLTSLIWLVESKEWSVVGSAVKAVCVDPDSSSNLSTGLKEVFENVLSIRIAHPSLSLLCCKLQTSLDIPCPRLWQIVLRSQQRKTTATSPNNSNNCLPSSLLGPSSCLSLQHLRQCGVLMFSSYVLSHICEEEWLAWILVQHATDVVRLSRQYPVMQLLHSVQANAAASALLLHALKTGDHLTKSTYGKSLLSVIGKVHVSQSGTLIIFLLEEMLFRPCFLHMLGSIIDVLVHRLKVIIAPQSSQILEQITKQKLQPYVGEERKALTISKCYPELSNLLKEVYNRILIKSHEVSVPLGSQSFSHSTVLDISWYIKLVTKRCSIGSGSSSEECCLLLRQLTDDSQLQSVMSSSKFDMRLLSSCLRYGFHATLQMNMKSSNSTSNSGSISPEHSTGTNSTNTSSVTSNSSNSSALGDEHPLYSVSKGVLVKQMQWVLAVMPKPHCDYRPGGGNKYSERVNQLFSSSMQSSELCDKLEKLTPACSELLNNMGQLSWKQDFLNNQNTNALLRVMLAAAEYSQYLIHQGKASVHNLSNLLQVAECLLGNSILSQKLLLSDHSSATLCTLVNTAYATVSFFIAPKTLAPLPENLATEVESLGSAGLLMSAGKLMQLVQWLENKNAYLLLPPHLGSVIRSIIMGTGRHPAVNSLLRCPPELWLAGYAPELYSIYSTHGAGSNSNTPSSYLLQPIPPGILQEPHILKQFIFRAQLLGWLNRQQFEETWMAILSVLSTATGEEDTDSQEEIYTNQSICLCIRGLSGLLHQMTLLPTPGDPLCTIVKNKYAREKSTDFNSCKSSKLRQVLLDLNNHTSLIDHLTEVAPSCELHATTDGATDVEVMGISRASSPIMNWKEGEENSKSWQSQLQHMGIDLVSCTHFLNDLFDTWLNQGKAVCSSVVSEVVKCLISLTDLLTSEDQLLWLIKTCLSLHSIHPVEDHSTLSYTLLAAAKALAVTRVMQMVVPPSLSDGVVHMLEAGLKSAIISTKMCAFRALLYLLKAEIGVREVRSLVPAKENIESPSVTSPEDSKVKGVTNILSSQISAQLPRTAFNAIAHHMKPVGGGALTGSPVPGTAVASTDLVTSLVQVSAPYITRACDARFSEGESHSLGAWDVCICLIENYHESLDSNFSCTALHLALSTAADNNTNPKVLSKVLHIVERILISSDCLQKNGTKEVVLKLVTDLVQNGAPPVSLKAVRLLVTTLYSHKTESSTDADTEPEVLMQLMERISVLFERIKSGYPHEAWLLSTVLRSCLLDLVPPNQVLNKVIMEYISSQQPQPHLLANVLFEVFRGCMEEESGEGLVQEWVLMSLGNFTRKEPLSEAVWCVTVFLVAASKSPQLLATFPNVVEWPHYQQYKEDPNHLLPDHIELFCLAAADFEHNLPSEQHSLKFRAVFSEPATPNSPFAKMLAFLDAKLK